MRTPALTTAVPQPLSRSVLSRALRGSLRLLWFALIPLLLSALGFRYLVPHGTSAHGLEGELAAFARAHSLLLTLLLFLSLASVLRYWRNWLLGGRYLSTLPDELVTRVPRRRIQVCESACALLSALEQGPVSKRISDSSAELQQSLDAAGTELASLLRSGKWSKVQLACDKLEQLARPLTSRKSPTSELLFIVL